jgi:phospholipid-binding lipoprotein MlaA
MKLRRLLGCALCALVLATLAGCATTSGNPRDPFEGFNRAVYSFNDVLDSAIVKPVAEGYRFVLPSPVRTGVTNFFSNIADPWIAVNNALQGKFTDAVQDLMRVFVNTLLGFGGILDIASEMGLQKHNEELGQTLGRWGVGSGPYLVLPFFGPSSFRDAPSLWVDWMASPLLEVKDVPVRNSLIALQGVSKRANLLDATNLLEEAALDKYSFTRDAFFQYRRNQIFDGNAPPLEPDAAIEPDEGEPKTAVVPLQSGDAVATVAPAAIAPASPPVAAAVAAVTTSAAGSELIAIPMTYTVFADGVVLKTPKAEPDATPATTTAVVRFSDNVVLQTR